jgi:hypothetical protein
MRRRQLHQQIGGSDDALRACHRFILQSLFEKVEIAELAFRSHLAEVRNLCRQVRQIALIAQDAQSFDLRRRALTSRARLNAS